MSVIRDFLSSPVARAGTMPLPFTVIAPLLAFTWSDTTNDNDLARFAWRIAWRISWHIFLTHLPGA
jgi:hypothetical protein